MKQYFAKLRQAEAGPEQEQQPSVKLNKAAAGRVIRHALAGNIDLQRAEREARERVLMGKRRMHTRFDEEKERPEVGVKKKRKVEVEEVEEGGVSSSSSSSNSEDEGAEEGEGQVESSEAPKKTHRRKQKDLKKAKMMAEGTWVGKEANQEETTEGLTKKKRRKKRKKSGGTEVQDASSSTPDPGQAEGNNGEGNGMGGSKQSRWAKKAIATTAT